jgi:hypothetical protein
VLGFVACQCVVCDADTPILDSSSYLYIGVTLSHYAATNPPQNINVVDIDLGAPGISFLVTPEVPGLPNNSFGTPYTVTRQFTLDFMTAQGAQIAVDAHRYWPTTGSNGSPVNLEGVVVSAGNVYESFFNAWRAPPPPGISWPALNIGCNNQVAILYGDPTDPLGHTPLPQVDDASGHHSMVPPMALCNTVSGNYQVVSNSIPITTNRLFLANDFNPNPRTGIGFTANNHLILATIDGGSNPWTGMRVIELGQFLASALGVVNAINADGGGSTTLVIATLQPHVVNVPSSGAHGRAVGGNLAVFAVPAYVAITNIADNSSFTAPVEIHLAANALASAGMVTNVSFYANAAIIGAAIASPFTTAWQNPPPDSYALQAVAMDNTGLNVTSAVVKITVVAAQNPLPGEGDTPLLPAPAQWLLILALTFAGLLCLIRSDLDQTTKP